MFGRRRQSLVRLSLTSIEVEKKYFISSIRAARITDEPAVHNDIVTPKDRPAGFLDTMDYFDQRTLSLKQRTRQQEIVVRLSVRLQSGSLALVTAIRNGLHFFCFDASGLRQTKDNNDFILDDTEKIFES